jgi:hypothetical protein
VCSVCGNDRCENFETCSNCPDDCGPCEINNCQEVIDCTLECIDFDSLPPSFSLTCSANCTAQSCSDVQFFVDQWFNCAIGALFQCAISGDCFGGEPEDCLNCINAECEEEQSACLEAECTQ